MVKHSLHIVAIGVAVSLGAVTQAAAGGCCGPIYVVNQGPVFSGPGPGIVQVPDRAPKAYPGAYPYVGFVYSGYPYGYYDAWVGAPVVEPIGYRPVRRYVKRPYYHRISK
jgi:hypothetical protein